MNDPHVVSLRYRIKTDKTVSYNNPPAVTVSEAAYDMTLVDDVLTVTMKEHHPTVGSAMARVRNHLRAWELQTAVDMGRGYLNFEFDNAEVIDRNPPPPGTSTAHMGIVGAAASFTATAECHIARAKYPDPPSRFLASSTVEHLWNRYQMYLEGRDLLTTMGYVCLSTIQSDAGGRGSAAAKFQIQRDVLDQLGTLTSDVGDEATARKFDTQSTKRAHTEAEKAWIEAAVQKIIRRVAEHDYDPTAALPQITMADLPPP
jgi:hypothetical protein